MDENVCTDQDILTVKEMFPWIEQDINFTHNVYYIIPLLIIKFLPFCVFIFISQISSSLATVVHITYVIDYNYVMDYTYLLNYLFIIIY